MVEGGAGQDGEEETEGDGEGGFGASKTRRRE